MAAYLVALAQITDFNDNVKKYAQLAAEWAAENGGEYLVRGPAAKIGEGELLEGRSVIVSRFPTMEQLKAFYESDRYQKEIKPLREGSGTFDIAMFEGVE